MIFFHVAEEERKYVFASNKDPHRIVELLSMAAGEKTSSKNLLIFDEILKCPEVFWEPCRHGPNPILLAW